MSKVVYSLDDDYFIYETIEEAIKAQDAQIRKFSYGPYISVGDIVEIQAGKGTRYRLSDFVTSVDSVISEIVNNAYKTDGFCDSEPANRYLEYLDDGLMEKEENALLNALKETIDKWADEHKMQPDFYAIELLDVKPEDYNRSIYVKITSLDPFEYVLVDYDEYHEMYIGD